MNKIQSKNLLLRILKQKSSTLTFDDPKEIDTFLDLGYNKFFSMAKLYQKSADITLTSNYYYSYASTQPTLETGENRGQILKIEYTDSTRLYPLEHENILNLKERYKYSNSVSNPYPIKYAFDLDSTQNNFLWIFPKPTGSGTLRVTWSVIPKIWLEQNDDVNTNFFNYTKIKIPDEFHVLPVYYAAFEILKLYGMDSQNFLEQVIIPSKNSFLAWAGMFNAPYAARG